MALNKTGVRTRRKVVASLPAELYIRLLGCKVRLNSTLERLLEEGARLVVEKYRAERESQTSDTSSPS